jgi:TolB protein
MRMNAALLAWASSALAAFFVSGSALAQKPATTPPDESVLGELPITGTTEERVPKIAVLPSLSPDFEDVIVRNVVRRDLELTGMYDVIPDAKAPPGLYGFDDPVDVDAWRKVGAEAIVKVSARKQAAGSIEVLGIAYFLNVGKEPVYQKKLVVPKDQARVTAHRVTDALLGALTGRPGGFASHFVFSARWSKNRRVFSMDSDGHALTPLTDPAHTAIVPAWGPNSQIFYTLSVNYAPFRLMRFGADGHKPVNVPFRTSIYSVALNKDYTRMAVAVAENAKTFIYVGNPDGSDMKKVSTVELATHAVFSPSGKIAYIAGGAKNGSQRVYVDNKPISPAGFTAAAPTFCNTEDGVRVIYAVSVGGNRQDLIMSNEKGQGVTRLTQNQGSNSYPACSPDGRLLAFFSTRGKDPGMYLMSLKRWKTQKLSGQHGESLRWDPLPPPAGAAP